MKARTARNIGRRPEAAPKGSTRRAMIGVASVLAIVAVVVTAVSAHADDNSPATGAPTLSGTVEVGETLTVDVSGISDADGLENAEFSFRWFGDYNYATEGGWVLPQSDAKSLTFEINSFAAGKAISVEVRFTDDAGNEERMISAPTGVVPGPIESITLVDTFTQTDVATFTGDGFIRLNNLSHLYAFRANLAEGAEVASMLVESDFPNGGWEHHIDSEAPFTTSGEAEDLQGNINLTGRRLFYSTHRIGWTAFDRPDARGEQLQRLDIAITVITEFDPEPQEPKDNKISAGAPTISGTARVGSALTAATGGVFDADGLENAVFSYQWNADGTAIEGATASTYTPTEGDEGKAITVTVTFTDDAGHEESLTSAATAAVTARPNRPATGAPTISGTAQVSIELTADTSGIADADGLDDAVFSYQWSAGGTAIDGATASTYTPTEGDEGQAITVTVTFTDDAGHEESLTSAATEAVSARPNRPASGAPAISGTAQVGLELTADTSGIADADGLDDAVFSYQWSAGGTAIDGATVSSYTPTEGDEGQAITVTVSFTDDAGHEESLTSAATAAVTARPNRPATGAPTISGTAQVGLELTADTSGIADADGLENAVFSYQWSAGGTAIDGATVSSYTPTEGDEGQTITVTVSFTDDAGHEESLTSAATAAVVLGGL